MALEGVQASTKGRWYLIAEQGDLTALVYPGMQLGEDAAGRFSLDPAYPAIELGVEGDLLRICVLTPVGGDAPPPLYVNDDTRVRVSLPNDHFIIDPAWASGRNRGEVIDIQVQPRGTSTVTAHDPRNASRRSPARLINEMEFGVLVTIAMLVLMVVLLSRDAPSSADTDPVAVAASMGEAVFTQAVSEDMHTPSVPRSAARTAAGSSSGKSSVGVSVADMTSADVTDLSLEQPADMQGFGVDVATVVPLLDALPLSPDETRQSQVIEQAAAIPIVVRSTAPEEQLVTPVMDRVRETPAVEARSATQPASTSSVLPLAVTQQGNAVIDVALSSLSPGIANPVLHRQDDLIQFATKSQTSDSLFPYGDLTVLRQRAPVYPRRAPTGASGHVDLTFTVNESGQVEAVVVEGNPPDYFARAAVTAVSKWRFEIVRVDGRPVAVRTRLRLSFQG